MTTLVFDIMARKLYTDSRATHTISSKIKGEAVTYPYIQDNFTKVSPSGNKDVAYTGTGSVEAIEKFFDSMRKGVVPKWLSADTTTYVVEKVPKLVITQYTGTGKGVKVTQVPNTLFHTNGSGSRYFSGALVALGSTSEAVHKAFEATFEMDNGSGGKVCEYDLSGRWYDEDKC